MNLITPFIALVRKDLQLFLSDRRALLVNLVLPIAIATFFGYMFGGSGGANKGTIEVALVQQDQGDIGRRIGAALQADPNLRVTAMNAADARNAVAHGKQKAAIVIPAGFGEAAGAALFGSGAKPAIAVLYDPSQNAVLAMVKGLLTQQVMQIVSAEMFGGKSGKAFTDASLHKLEAALQSDPANASLRDFLGSLKKFQASPAVQGKTASGKPAAGLSMPFTTDDEQVTNGPKEAGFNGYAHAFAGMGVQFILFLGIDMGIGILLARRSGIFNRLLAAPIGLNTVLLARAASGAIIAFGLLCVMFAFAMAVFGVRIANPAGFIGVGVCFAIITACFGLLIAAFGQTPEAARGIAIFATLIMVMLGGAWIPSFLFPQWVQQVGLAVPTRWAIDGLDAVTWRGLGFEAAATSMAALLGFALLFAALALMKFRHDRA